MSVQKSLYDIQKIACNTEFLINFQTASPWFNRVLSRGVSVIDFGENHMEMVTGYGFGKVKTVSTNDITLESTNGVVAGAILVNTKTNDQVNISAVKAGNIVTVADGSKFKVGDNYLVMDTPKIDGQGKGTATAGLSRNINNHMQIFTNDASFTLGRYTQAQQMITAFNPMKGNTSLPRELIAVYQQQIQNMNRSATIGKGTNNADGVPSMKGWLSYFGDGDTSGLPRVIAGTKAGTDPTADESTNAMDEMILLAMRQGFDFNGASFQLAPAMYKKLMSSDLFVPSRNDDVLGRSVQTYIGHGQAVAVEMNIDMIGKNDIVLWNDSEFELQRFGDEFLLGIEQPVDGRINAITVTSQVTVLFRGIASAIMTKF